MKFHEEAFEAAAEITAAVAEEAEIELNAQGAEKAAEFFSVLYKKLAAVARGEEEVPEEKPEKKRVEVREHVPAENEQPQEDAEIPVCEEQEVCTESAESKEG